MSDTHARFPNLSRENFQAIIHTGDIFPDPISLHDLDNPSAYQIHWLENHLEDFKKMSDGKPFFFVEGNHDFIPANYVQQILNDAGIEAYSLEEKIVNYDGINFYGLPFVPYIDGSFNHERHPADMAIHIDKMAAALNKTYVDIIAAHAPPNGCLDLTFSQNNRFGNSAMNVGLDYKINKDMLPSHYLCGHIHSSHGIAMRNGMLISNAATVFHLLEIN